MTEAAVNLEELVASERERVLRLCGSKIRDKAAAEDVTQEILIKFVREVTTSAEPIREPKALLTRIAENACADYGRGLVKRLKGRRPQRKPSNNAVPEKPPRQASLLYASELPRSRKIDLNDEPALNPFSKAIDQAAMDQTGEDDSDSDEYDELGPSQVHLLGRLRRPERLAFLLCGPWHLSEYDASMFLGAKLAKRVVKERRDWPTGVPIVKASRVFNIKEGTLSSQISRATAKLRSKLSHLKTVRPTGSKRSPDDQMRQPMESAVEPVANHPPPTNPASQAFARIVVGEPSRLVPGWAGTPPSRSADLPSREFSQIDQREALRRISKPCGSPFKGCMNCGDVVYGGKCRECRTMIYHTEQTQSAACDSPSCMEQRPMVKLRKYYTSGFLVRKAYSPQAAGFTYWCYLCGARDENCWEGFVGESGRGNAASGGIARKCSRILQLLKVAEKPEDMEIAGLHFHALEGNPKRWSVCATVNDRITFGWLDKSVSDVSFEDFYQGRTEVMERKNGRPVHPGAIIKQDILPSVGLSVTAAAKALGVAPKTLQNILKKRKALSVPMCLRVSRLFGSAPEFWMRSQAAYDLKKAQQDKKLMARVARIVPLKEPVEEVRT